MTYGFYPETCQKNKIRLLYNQAKSLAIVEARICGEEIGCCSFLFMVIMRILHQSILHLL